MGYIIMYMERTCVGCNFRWGKGVRIGDIDRRSQRDGGRKGRREAGGGGERGGEREGEREGEGGRRGWDGERERERERERETETETERERSGTMKGRTKPWCTLEQ